MFNKFVLRSLFIAIISIIAIFMQSTPTNAQDEERQVVKGSSPGYYYIPAENVAQNSQSAAIALTIGDRIPAYLAGMQVVFETETLNGNNANITIRINNLAVKKLLSRDGDEFGIGALDAGVTLTATFNGTDFRADFNPRPQFRYIEPLGLVLSGNAYSIVDTSIPPIATAPVLLGIKAKATNTGNVTLSVNSSTAYPIFLSNGDQIPAGALEDGTFIFCIFTTVGGVGFRAINLHPARSLKGIYVATLPIPSGDYLFGQYVGGWEIINNAQGFSAVASGIDLFNLMAVANAVLASPTNRYTVSQLGWYFEMLNGTTLVTSGFLAFGDTSDFSAPFTVSDNANLRWVFNYDEAALQPNTNNPSFSLTSGVNSLTIPVTIPATADYNLYLYVAEN